MYRWFLWFKPSLYWAHLVIWFLLLVSTRGSFSCLVLKSWWYSYSSRRFLMILEWTFICSNRPSMLKSYWQHPWKRGRDFCQTWWKYRVDKDGDWKGGGWGQADSTVDTFLEVSGAGVERWDWQVDVGIVLGALFWKDDEIHTHLGGYWWFLSDLCI